MTQSGLPDVASRSFGRRGEVWLPSRRWAVALGNNATNLFEDEDDYDPPDGVPLLPRF
jgi:hypothetical protein